MIQAKGDIKPVRPLGGLVTDGSVVNRPPNSWTVLQNLDLYITGSVRKMRGWRDLLGGSPPTVYRDQAGQVSPIVEATVYRRRPEEDRIVVGICENGCLYNLETSLLLGMVPISIGSAPSLAVMPGLVGDVLVNYLVITTEGGALYKWDGGGVITRVGCQQASPAVQIRGLYYTTDPARGIPILASRRYRWAYFNPTTKLESSLSDIIEVDEPWPSVIAQGAMIYPPANTQATMIMIDTLTTALPVYGDGYTRKRIYTSRDGSQTFFLNTGLLDEQGRGADVDGSYSYRERAFFDGVYLQTGTPATDDLLLGDQPPPSPAAILQALPPQAPTPDAALIEPGSDDHEFDPPPSASLMTVYQDRIWVVHADKPASLHFSNIESFEQFAPSNHIVVPASAYDEIVALSGQKQQLIIGKKHGSHRIIGVDFADFSLNPIDTQIGFTSRRGHVDTQGRLYFKAWQGIMVWADNTPTNYGESIKRVTDRILDESAVLATVLSRQGFVMFAVLLAPEVLVDGGPADIGYWLIVADVSVEQPFSLYGPLPSPPTMLREVEFEDDSVGVIMGTEEGRVYQLFVGKTALEAIATTQRIPLDDLTQNKVYRMLRVDGDELEGWTLETSVDDGPFSSPKPVRRNSFIGQTGKGLVVRFRHTGPIGPVEPQLSNYLVDYVSIGESF